MNRKDWEAQVFASDMNQTAKWVAMVVGSFGNWNENRTVWPSIKAVADMAGINRDTAAKYVEALLEQGWLEHVATRKNNVREFELLPQVAEPIGILAKPKRQLTDRQLSNLSATSMQEDAEGIDNQIEQVAETTEVGCRNDKARLPKREGLVVDSIDTNIKEPTIKNIKEHKEVSPVPDGPVDSESSSNLEVKKPRYYLNPSEKKAFDASARWAGATEEQAIEAIAHLTSNRNHALCFTEKVDEALRAVGLEVEEW